MKRVKQGFTLVELIVVIAVIGILAAVTVIGLSRYQADTRDARRVSSANVIAEALEKYYDENGEYPGCSILQSDPASVLEGVSVNTLVAPQADSGTTNSLSCATLSADGDDFFEYEGDGSSACSSGTSCLAFTLKYKDEADGTIREIDSRRSTAIATSGASTLSAGSVSFTQVTLSWTAVQNAASYDLERNGSTSTVTGTSATITGLNKNTAYAFRIRPVGPSGPGNWSNTVNITTLSLATPSVNATADSATAYTASWGSIANATGYTVQCSTDNVTWGSGCQATTSSTSYQFTNGTMGERYYVRVQATNTSAPGGPHTSNWSTADSVYTIVTPPASYTITGSNPAWNTLRGTSNAVCTGGSTPEYVWYANGSVWSGATAQTVTYTLSWNQSVTLSVNTRCVFNGQSSAYTTSSNTISRSLPGPYAWAGNCAYRTACWDGSCPSGTTSGYIWWRVSASSWSAGSTAGVGYGTWYNGAAWGDGSVRSTTYCSGPWGTVTSDGWGPFGSGCVPNITNPSRCYA